MAIMVTAGMGIGTLTTMDMVGIMAEVDIIGADMAMAGIDERLSEGGKDSRSRNVFLYLRAAASGRSAKVISA